MVIFIVQCMKGKVVLHYQCRISRTTKVPKSHVSCRLQRSWVVVTLSKVDKEIDYFARRVFSATDHIWTECRLMWTCFSCVDSHITFAQFSYLFDLIYVVIYMNLPKNLTTTYYFNLLYGSTIHRQTQRKKCQN